MNQTEMLEGAWPHPVEDTDGDKVITLKEKAWYVIKMIPWTIMAILVPTLKWAVRDGIKEMWPIALVFVRDIALSQIPGHEKAAVVRQQLLDAAKEKGVVLATRDINRLIENALAVIEQETQ